VLFELKEETTLTMLHSLSEYDRAKLRAMLAPPSTAPGAFTNENIRRLLGADETCMTCPRYGTAAQGWKLCKEFRCDECGYRFAKST
jgi:hypothetical protein